MQKIYKKSFSIQSGINNYTQEKKCSKEDFLLINVENILIYHHKNKADVTYFYLSNEKESNKLLFLVNQDKNLIKELNMLIPNREKTLNLLENSEQNDFSSILLQKLYNNLNGNQSDYEIEINGIGYSFRFVQGIKVKNILEKLNEYQKKIENIKEYKNDYIKIKY